MKIGALLLFLVSAALVHADTTFVSIDCTDKSGARALWATATIYSDQKGPFELDPGQLAQIGGIYIPTNSTVNIKASYLSLDGLAPKFFSDVKDQEVNLVFGTDLEAGNSIQTADGLKNLEYCTFTPVN